ncbi:MAG: GldG family protein [Candidatus Cloacimonadaceae bacterium]|nr:GldG family protein [Candidatus Cloacimonadota bacterium]MDD2544355.1 GldG family protein [Candidatus Cloacimonadota bacterium]
MKKIFGILSSLSVKIGIVVAILLIVPYLNLRVDLSSQKAYSLSRASKELMRSLEDVMVVKIIVSEDLPAELNSLNRYLQDLLNEYQLNSRGKFRYEYVRNLSWEKLYGMAHENGVRVMRIQIYERDQMISKEVIFGAIFEYQGKVQSLSLLPRIEPKLEYEITQCVQSLAKHKLPKVAVFRDTTYYDFDTQSFERNLAANFTVVDADLSKPISEVDALLFTGTARSLPIGYLYNLDQYLMKGGRVVFLQDRVDTDGYNLYPMETNVIEILEHYGFELSRDLVLDLSSDKRQTGLGVMANYPMYPVLRGGKHPITNNIDNIVMYLASGISFKGTEGTNFEPILQSSIYSGWMEHPKFEVDQDLFYDPQPQDFTAGPITTAAVIKGRISSFFTDSELAANDPGFVGKSPEQQLILFGDKELVIDADREIYNNRNYIILNALDYLSGRDDLIHIRSRHLSSSHLSVPRFMNKMGIVWGDVPKIEKNIKNAAKAIAIVLPALILILIGLIRYLRRKAHIKMRYE